MAQDMDSMDDALWEAASVLSERSGERPEVLAEMLQPHRDTIEHHRVESGASCASCRVAWPCPPVVARLAAVLE